MIKRKLALPFILLAILIVTIYLDRIIIYAISKTQGLDVSYKKLTYESFKEFTFNELKIMDSKMGVGLLSKYAKVRPKWKIGSPREIIIDFDMDDVRFIKKAPEDKEIYDTLSDLVYIPFMSRWTYEEIKGRLQMFRKGIHLKDFAARSADIRLSLEGGIYHDNTLKLDAVIYFSKKLTGKIPDILSNVVLQDEEDEWKSLSVSLGGNYNTPSIQVSGKLFRLNIKASSFGETVN